MTRNDAIDYQYSLAVAGCDHVHDLPLDIHPAVATQLGALPQLGPGVRDCGVSLTRAANDTLRKKNVRKIYVNKKIRTTGPVNKKLNHLRDFLHLSRVNIYCTCKGIFKCGNNLSGYVFALDFSFEIKHLLKC